MNLQFLKKIIKNKMNNYQEYIYLSYIFTITTLVIYFMMIYKNYRKTSQHLKGLYEKK